tara:strand:+ start:128 stop:328 length:201 start_codon:yes stop_codon:yes gene_type:complete
MSDNIKTAAKVGSIYYDLNGGEGFVVLNERWHILLGDVCELDVLQDILADLTRLYEDRHAEVFTND